jgi:ribosomal protein S18 acetylase RimI-like enzyme
MDFRFTNEFNPARLDEVVAYMLGPRLWVPQNDYPDVWDWAQRAHAELRRQTKRALVAFDRGEVVGVVVYQRHKRRHEAMEIKRLTVRPDQRGRYIASFLLRNAEIEGTRDYNCRYALTDSKARNLGIKGFLLRHHYQVVDRTDLYGLGAGEDLVYQKDLWPGLVVS